jgi:hypothetical protein
MKVGAVAHSLPKGWRVRITWPDGYDEAAGAWRWSAALTDAQLLAYQECETFSVRMCEEERTAYVILGKACAAQAEEADT